MRRANCFYYAKQNKSYNRQQNGMRDGGNRISNSNETSSTSNNRDQNQPSNNEPPPLSPPPIQAQQPEDVIEIMSSEDEKDDGDVIDEEAQACRGDDRKEERVENSHADDDDDEDIEEEEEETYAYHHRDNGRGEGAVRKKIASKTAGGARGSYDIWRLHGRRPPAVRISPPSLKPPPQEEEEETPSSNSNESSDSSSYAEAAAAGSSITSNNSANKHSATADNERKRPPRPSLKPPPPQHQPRQDQAPLGNTSSSSSSSSSSSEAPHVTLSSLARRNYKSTDVSDERKQLQQQRSKRQRLVEDATTTTASRERTTIARSNTGACQAMGDDCENKSLSNQTTKCYECKLWVHPHPGCSTAMGISFVCTSCFNKDDTSSSGSSSESSEDEGEKPPPPTNETKDNPLNIESSESSDSDDDEDGDEEENLHHNDDHDDDEDNDDSIEAEDIDLATTSPGPPLWKVNTNPAHPASKSSRQQKQTSPAKEVDTVPLEDKKPSPNVTGNAVAFRDEVSGFTAFFGCNQSAPAAPAIPSGPRKPAPLAASSPQKSRSIHNNKLEAALEGMTQQEKSDRWAQIAASNGGWENLGRKPWMNTNCFGFKNKPNDVCVLPQNNAMHSRTALWTLLRDKPARDKRINAVCETKHCLVPQHCELVTIIEATEKKVCCNSIVCPICGDQLKYPCPHEPRCLVWRKCDKPCSNCEAKQIAAAVNSSKEAESDMSSNDSAPPPPSMTRSPQQRQAREEQEHRPSVLEAYANHPLRKQFEDGDTAFEPTDYEFCCAHCRCKFGSADNDNLDYIPRSWPDGSFWGDGGMTLHRKCCHGNNKHNRMKWEDLSEKHKNKDGHFKAIPHGSASRHYKECVDHRAVLSWRREQQDERDDAMIEHAPDVKHFGVWKALKHDRHRANLERHDELRKAAGPKRQGGMVVLDCFAGQGTGLVALKKNGIRVKKYISVEHDKVAVHVSRYNHDTGYRKALGLDDQIGYDIEYLHFDCFEDVDAKIDNILDEHGPIDLVLGSPPCSQYTKVNAKAKGTKAPEGRYFVQLGELIQRMKQHQKQQNRHLYFLVENVVISEKDDDKVALDEAYGAVAVEVEAKDFSPQWRSRAFYTNLPLYEGNFECGAGKLSGAKSCLDGGFMLPADYGGSDDDNDNIDLDDFGGQKCYTLLASKGRLYTPPMKVVRKKEDGKFEARYLTARERSRLMGYNDNFVAEPLSLLFQELSRALLIGRLRGFTWDKDLREEFRVFSGLPFNMDMYYGDLMVAPPPYGHKYTVSDDGELSKCETGTIQYLDEEDYGCHLVGNAYSVPVMATFLKPLQDIYESGTDYEGFRYKYPWELR